MNPEWQNYEIRNSIRNDTIQLHIPSNDRGQDPDGDPGPEDYVRKRKELEEIKKEMKKLEKEKKRSFGEAEYINKSRYAYEDRRLCKRGLAIDLLMPETQVLSDKGMYYLLRNMMDRKEIRDLVSKLTADYIAANPDMPKPYDYDDANDRW